MTFRPSITHEFFRFCFVFTLRSEIILFLYDSFLPYTELPFIGAPNWYYMCLLSPYAGVYYWRSGDRVDEFSIKLEANDDETENSISVLGSEDEMERMWRALEWTEKGMVMVRGLLDN